MISVPSVELRAHGKEPRVLTKMLRALGSGLCRWVYELRAWSEKTRRLHFISKIWPYGGFWVSARQAYKICV